MKINKILIVLTLVLCFASVAASASPDVIWPGESGNASDLIVITNPPSDKAATFDRSYIISGYGKEGSTVTLYQLQDGAYRRTSYTWQIGASGLFFKRIELGRGKNSIICYAEINGSNQLVPLEITYLGTGFSDTLNGIKVDASTIPFGY